MAGEGHMGRWSLMADPKIFKSIFFNERVRNRLRRIEKKSFASLSPRRGRDNIAGFSFKNNEKIVFKL